MERATGQPVTSRVSLSWSWRRIAWQVMPVVAVALGAVLLARDLAGGGGTTPPSATVDSQYEQRLAANIKFFESRVSETRDSLSYNRLVSLYLERLRLTGDTADVARAELAATESVRVAAGTYASTIAMAQVRLAQHDFPGALQLSNEAAALKPEANDPLAISGDAKMALGRYAEAGEDYRLYLEKEPGFGAFARQAVFAETNGNIPLATQFWHAAIDASAIESPIDSAWALVQLGNLQATNNDLTDASKQFEAALRVYPGYALAEAGQARVAAMSGEFEESLELYRKVTAKLPSPEFIVAHLEAAERAGNTQEAERQIALLGAIGQLFEANGIRNDLTLINFELDHGDPASALPKAEAAYRERPSLAAADTYAWALYRAGRLDEARRHADESLRLGTREPLYLFHAGMIAAAQGDSAEGRKFLARALELNPNFHPLHAPEAKRTLKRLEASR
jgi:tetratricopeptide (TPR) repeat protein